jgi:hypothetical protein
VLYLKRGLKLGVRPCLKAAVNTKLSTPEALAELLETVDLSE